MPARARAHHHDPAGGVPLGAGRGALAGLVGLLGVAGAAHFATPAPFARIVPRVLGRPEPWVEASGVAELACAAGLLVPRTRRAAALAAAGLFVAVYPANLVMAVQALRSERAPGWYRTVALVRLPLQVPLVLWALRTAGAAGAAGPVRGASR